MSKKQPNMQRKEGGLRCPVCRRFINYIPEIRGFGLAWEDVMLPKPGDLTACDHCGAMLEFGGVPTSLTLRPARQERIDAFNELGREAAPEPSFPTLVEYVRKYTRMPARHRIGHRFRKLIRLAAL